MTVKEAIEILSTMNQNAIMATTDDHITGEFLVFNFIESSYEDETGNHPYIEIELENWPDS